MIRCIIADIYCRFSMTVDSAADDSKQVPSSTTHFPGCSEWKLLTKIIMVASLYYCNEHASHEGATSVVGRQMDTAGQSARSRLQTPVRTYKNYYLLKNYWCSLRCD